MCKHHTNMFARSRTLCAHSWSIVRINTERWCMANPTPNTESYVGLQHPLPFVWTFSKEKTDVRTTQSVRGVCFLKDSTRLQCGNSTVPIYMFICVALVNHVVLVRKCHISSFMMFFTFGTFLILRSYNFLRLSKEKVF